jgi:hypothetical protein
MYKTMDDKSYYSHQGYNSTNNIKFNTTAGDMRNSVFTNSYFNNNQTTLRSVAAFNDSV